MKVAAFTLAALLLASPLAPPPAAAEEFSPEKTRQVMAGYAECVVKRRPDMASEAILANVDNHVIARKYRQLIVPDCLNNAAGFGTEMRFGGDLYRYALADALISLEMADQPVPDLSAVPQLEHPAPPEKPSEFKKSGKRLSKRAYADKLKDYAEDFAFAFLSRYGECVVRTDPSGARALALSAATSEAEKARFRALQPALGACLEAGQKLEFGMAALRGAIAINYYRLAHAARGTVTKAG